ncbi:MAG: Crp/Fnr family transcriptional regulator [Devosia sp.]
MRDTLLTKLEHFAQLSTADRRVLATLAQQRVHHFGPHEDIMREGESPAFMNLVRDGWACRYKTLEDGRRQIMAFLLPGDICDLDAFLTHETDHSIAAITPVTLAQINRDEFDALSDSHPHILEALRWASMVDGAIQREWTVNLGQRDASERLAHLLCELFVRLETAGLTEGDACDFPLTQSELGEATGLSTVHVNRTLRELRDAGLIVLKDRTLRIPDIASLKRHAMFNANYIHLDRERRDFSADLH